MDPRPRSPIDAMIDKACGVPPGWQPTAPARPPPEQIDAEAKALLEIAAAAKAWRRSPAKGAARLRRAVDRWLELGG